jgi:hypothetical protein
MSLLSINWQALDFERGLAVLRSSLDAATGALEANREAIQKDWDGYEDALNNGVPADEIWEDDVKVWDQGHAHENDIRLILETREIMLKAHAIAAYHLWERIVRSWTKAPAKADHEMLVKLVEAKGITVHFRMAAIRDLNNALKHNSEKYGPALLVSWPELFSARFREGIRHRLAKISGDPTASKVNWHEAITINSDQMDELMDAVRASGPIGAVVRRPGAMLSAPE